MEITKALANKSVQENCGTGFWAGLTDREEEGRFVGVNTGRETHLSIWRQGQPNGGNTQECYLVYSSGALNDISCNAHHCFLIDLPAPPKYQMRGVCQGSHVDTYFVQVLSYQEQTNNTNLVKQK